MKVRYVAMSVLAALALAGCASPDGTDSAGAPSPTAASPTTAVPPSGSLSALPGPSASLSGAITVTGEIRDGVEAGCVLLATAKETYLLLGGDRGKYRSGVTLTVTGVPQPDMASTCQQGMPFRVVSIKEG